MPQASKKHSFIHDISVASPCSMNWDAMDGDDRTRHCGQCKLNVFNLSSMTEAEIESLLMEKEGRVCVRFFRRTDGTILTRDCPIGVAARVRSYARKTCAAAATLISVVSAYVLALRNLTIPTTHIECDHQRVAQPSAPPGRLPGNSNSDYILGAIVTPPAQISESASAPQPKSKKHHSKQHYHLGRTVTR